MACTDCPLHLDAISNCIPGRYLRGGPAPSGSPCLVLVGMAPGLREDEAGTCWTGKAGFVLDTVFLAYLEQQGALTGYSVFATNTLRCFVPQSYKPKISEIKKCRRHLEAELHTLAAIHSPLTILALGGEAARTTGKRTLKKCFRFQGELTAWPSSP